MAWCEAHDEIYYVLGLARNKRLEKELAPSLVAARALYEQTQKAARVFHEFVYRTRKSWSRARRVIGKAEVMALGNNPRFIVTNLGVEQQPGQHLYEQVYCARGDMENRIKEQQLALFADRTSTATLRANQLRLYFSSIAYTLMQGFTVSCRRSARRNPIPWKWFLSQRARPAPRAKLPGRLRVRFVPV